MLLGLPLTASADTKADTIYINIHSLDEWKKYAKEYGNSKDLLEKYYIKLKLCNDISFDNTKGDYVVKTGGFYTYWGYFNGSSTARDMPSM